MSKKCEACNCFDEDKFTEKELQDAIAQTIFGCIDEETLVKPFGCSFIEGDIENGKYILHVTGHRFGDREYEIKMERIVK